MENIININPEEFYKNKKRDEAMTNFLLHNNYITIIDCPLVDCAALFFKDNKFINSAKIVGIVPKVLCDIVDEEHLLKTSVFETITKTLDEIDHDKVIYCLPYEPNTDHGKKMDEGIQKFMEREFVFNDD